jgi:aminoglycoside phosphotransferase (APT) family kinase protein
VVVTHGDYRLDNTVVGLDGTIRAVLDWELSTLGDPLADLGTLVVYSTGAAGPGRAIAGLPGFPSPAEMAARYAAASGRDVGDLGYYVAFAQWRLACIVEGIYAPRAGGAMGGDRPDLAALADQTALRAEAAKRALERWP